MIIENVYIKSFGKLHDFSLSFDSRMNVIEGNNESGKSTLAAFIRFILYGFPAHGQEMLSEKQKRLSWENGTAAGKMTVSADGHRYEIERRVVRTVGDATEETLTATDLATGLPAFSRVAPGEALLGVPRSLFDSTAFLAELTDSRVGGAPIAEAIENLIFSGDEKINTERALREIDEARSSLLHPSGKGGALYVLRQKQAELEKRLGIAKREQASILEKEAVLAKTLAKKQESEKNEAACKKLETDYKNAMLIKTFDYLHELEENSAALREEIRARDEKNTIDGFALDEKALAELHARSAVMKEKEREKEEAEIAYEEAAQAAKMEIETAKLISLADAHGGTDTVRVEAKQRHFFFRLFSILAAVAGGLAAGVFLVAILVFRVFFDAPPEASYLTLSLVISLLVAGTVLLVLAFYHRKHYRLLADDYGTRPLPLLLKKLLFLAEVKDKAVRLSVTAEERRKVLLRREESYLDYFEELSRYLMQMGETLPEEAPSAFVDVLAERIAEELEKRNDLLGKKAGIDRVIAELRTQLGDKSEVQVRATVPPGDRERLVAMNHKDILDGIERYRRLAHFYDDRVRETERQLIAARERAEDPLLLTARIAEQETQIESMLLRHSAYDIADTTIRAAGERLRTEISPRLAGYAGRLMEVITSGKYKKVAVTKNIELAFQENQRLLSAEFMSAGTRDVAYLSLRMALVDLLYDEMPPLFFDETFAHQDDTRARGLLRGIEMLAKEGKQVFLFTCHGREATLAKEENCTFSHIRF